jgi:hypothetical protein
VKVDGLTPGEHGVHIHSIGSCSPTFDATGPHHNPLAALHGHHASDLPDLVVNSAGRGRLNGITEAATLSDGPTTLFDDNGSAVIVLTRPAGRYRLVAIRMARVRGVSSLMVRWTSARHQVIDGLRCSQAQCPSATACLICGRIALALAWAAASATRSAVVCTKQQHSR